MKTLKFTRKIVFGLALSFAILGMVACGVTSTPVGEAPDTLSSIAVTEGTEGIEAENEPVDGSADLIIVEEEGYTTIDEAALEEALSEVAVDGLRETEAEAEGLLFMREEEKLARDVYLTLYEQWGLNIFQNIAFSEQSHTDAVKALLDKYSLEDPMKSDERGVFENPVLQALYDQLVAQGSQSLGEALKVGAAIEEIDILDLEEYIAQTDKDDIQRVYENLLKGSRNHLRSFVSTIQRQTGETYQPQYLSAEAYQAIVSSEIETGSYGQGKGNR